MIKRIRQNRSLRPSNRQKFKADNRETIFAGANNKDKAIFKEFSESEVNMAIHKIREEAKSKRRRELGLLIISIVVISVFIFYSLKPSKSLQVKSQDVKRTRPKLIIWNGKRSEPIKVPYSDFLYVPIIGDLNDEMDLKRTYEIKTSNLAVKYTSNIIFFDKDTTEIRKLLPENGSVNIMFVGPGKDNFEFNKIIYAIAENDTNNDGKVASGDKYFLYFSELDGTGLTRITERNPTAIGWTKGGEIFLEFESTENKNDSLYGLYDTKSKTLKQTNQSIYK